MNPNNAVDAPSGAAAAAAATAAASALSGSTNGAVVNANSTSNDTTPAQQTGVAGGFDPMGTPNQVHPSEEEHAAPFFADMTLDLAEAHDIAETPEVKRNVVVGSALTNPMASLQMPSIQTIDEGEEKQQGQQRFDDLRPQSLEDGPLATVPVDEDVEGGAIQHSNDANINTDINTDINSNANANAAHSDDGASDDGQFTGTMHRISSDQLQRSNAPNGAAGGAYSAVGGATNGYSRGMTRMTPSQRRYPRDVRWVVAFCIFVPLSLIVPIFASPRIVDSDGWLATAASPRLAITHTLFWGLLATLVLCRLLYRSMGGGDGDDARHLASQVLLISGPMSASVYLALILIMLWMIPGAFHLVLIPIWYLARDVYLFRRWKRTSTTPGGRQAFFQALSCMTLDIISRSLRRSSFHRFVLGMVLIQFVVIYIWRLAILGAIRSSSTMLVLMALIGGKWATGVVARLLSLVVSGGVSNWFAQQNELFAEASRQINVNNGQQQQQQQQHQSSSSRGGSAGGAPSAADGVETIDFSSDVTDGDVMGAMPEAYRSADASAYKPAVDMDEGMDDDFEDEEEETFANFYGPRSARNATPATSTSTSAAHRSTVKNLVVSGLTVSFGSVSQCGLLGGVAQMIWSQIRKVDHARQTLSGFRGMDIGMPDASEVGMLSQLCEKLNLWARDFVRDNSDLAMCHVAAYQKGYRRAARDVAQLVEESGVEPLIDEDISTHMSSCVGGSISGMIVIFTGIILIHHRNKSSPNTGDTVVAMDMLLAFILCYSLIFTVMEPLRAGIKAVYVSFAEHPQSLSQTYPLIFRRMSRMSESNNMT